MSEVSERDQAIIDCVKIAWQRVVDCHNATALMDDAGTMMLEAFLISDRLKALAPHIDWVALGLHVIDDPRNIYGPGRRMT